jgi:hypothetical protein
MTSDSSKNVGNVGQNTDAESLNVGPIGYVDRLSSFKMPEEFWPMYKCLHEGPSPRDGGRSRNLYLTIAGSMLPAKAQASLCWNTIGESPNERSQNPERLGKWSRSRG